MFVSNSFHNVSGIYDKGMINVSHVVYILATTYLMAFIFGPWMPWMDGIHFMTSDPSVLAPACGKMSKSRTH